MLDSCFQFFIDIKIISFFSPVLRVFRDRCYPILIIIQFYYYLNFIAVDFFFPISLILKTPSH